MKKLLIYILLAVVIGSCQSSEKQNKMVDGTIIAIDSLVNQGIDQKHFAGAVMRVQRGDSILHRKAYGFAQKYNMELQEIDQPEKMTPEHLFDLASLTKVFGTTFGIMLLVDAGKIQLDDTISKWLPEFIENEKKQITVRHLLTHSAGLYQWKPTYYFASTKPEQYEYIAALPLSWPVGEGRHYSDLGFMLLGEIIERVSGQPLDEFLREELFGLLDLRHTTFNPNEKNFKKIVATSHGNPFEKRMVYDDDFGYGVDVDPKSWDGWRNYTLYGEVNDGNAWYGAGGVAGHAGLFSTAGDLQKLLALLLNKGSYGGKQLISAAVIDTFLTKNEFGNGLGWAMDPDVISTRGAPAGTYGHTGFTGTNVVVIPEQKLTIILLTNRQHVGPQGDGYYASLNNLRQQVMDEVIKIALD